MRLLTVMGVNQGMQQAILRLSIATCEITTIGSIMFHYDIWFTADKLAFLKCLLRVGGCFKPSGQNVVVKLGFIIPDLW